MSVNDVPVAARPARIARYAPALCALAAIGPLTMDMYLPALPRMAGDLHTSNSAMQLALTAYLAALAVGIFVLGPVSDAIGRRRPLVAGLALYILASVVCVVSVSAPMFLAGRTAQGLGAAAGIVISRAAARDLFSGTAASRVFSALMLVHGGGPMIAPLVGSQVVVASSWRGVFAVLAGVGVVVLLVVVVALPETVPRSRRVPARLGSTLRRYRDLLGEGSFVAYAVIFSIVFGGLFVYVGASSFVLQDVYGLSAQQYGLVYAVNGMAIAIAGLLNAYLVGRVQERTLLAAGVVATAVGAAGVLVAAVFALGLMALLVPLLIVVGSIGVVAPSATALALADQQEHAGSAAALLAVLQLVAAGLGSMAGGGGGRATPVSMGAAMAGFAAIALVALLMSRRTAATVRE